MISRTEQVSRALRLLRHNPVVALLGARQVGKTTLAGQVAAARGGPATRFDLEDPRDLARLDDPIAGLEPLRGLVVLDEVQRRPEIFSVLRVLADRPRWPARFLVLGSASPYLLQQSSESLAGRIAYLELAGFDLTDVGVSNWRRLWIRGGFPRSYLARSNAASLAWRRDFLRTFLEQDLPQFGVRTPAPTLRRFWSMLAHYHGQMLNSSELARSFGVADTTIRHYLDVLTATFMVRQLQPWHANVAKRQVKAPRIYLADSGLLHSLLEITDDTALERHPKVGASWEGFAMDTVIRQLGVRSEECHFWRTHAGAELDLFVRTGNQRLGFEFKKNSAPTVTPSMRQALADLSLDRLDVIYPGKGSFPMGPGIRAVPLSDVSTLLKRIGGSASP